MSSPTTIIPNSIFERKPLYDRQKKALNDKESMEDAEAEVDIDVFPDEESSRCPTPSSPINSSKYTCETNPFFVPIVPPGLVPEFDATIPPPQICGIFITEFEGIDMNNDILCPKKEVTVEKEEYSDYSSMGSSSPQGTPLKYNIESNECYGHYARTKLTVNFIEYDDGQGSIARSKKTPMDGRSYSECLSAETTHLVVGKAQRTEKYKTAIKRIPLIRPIGLMTSGRRRRRRWESSVDSEKMPSIQMAVTSIDGCDRSSLIQLIEENGGKIPGSMNRARCSHLVTDKTCGEKYLKATEWTEIRIVQTHGFGSVFSWDS
ncbi:unnamed protein product [Caenorhabditis brenneri]